MPFANPAKKQAYDAARYAANREAIKARARAYRKANPESLKVAGVIYRMRNQAALKARNADYYQRTRCRRDTLNKAWRAIHPEERAMHLRRSKERHPETSRNYKKRRKARIRGAVEVERFAALEIYERDKWVCGICQEVITLGDESLDHIKPVSKGGPHTRANVRAAHRVCNRNRGNRE